MGVHEQSEGGASFYCRATRMTRSGPWKRAKRPPTRTRKLLLAPAKEC